MGPEIFLVVMICSGDLLDCDNRSSGRPFQEMDDCHHARSVLLADVSEFASEEQILFARCEYVLTHEPSNRPRPPSRLFAQHTVP